MLYSDSLGSFDFDLLVFLFDQRVGHNSQVFHTDGESGPWEEWLDPGLDWQARGRALLERPRTDREDWYSRVLLAARHRPPP